MTKPTPFSLKPRKVPRPTIRRTRMTSSCLGSPPKHTGQSTKEYVVQYFKNNRIFHPCKYLIGDEEVVA